MTWLAAHLLFRLVPVDGEIAETRILVIEEVCLIHINEEKELNSKITNLGEQREGLNEHVLVRDNLYKRQFLKGRFTSDIISCNEDDSSDEVAPVSVSEISWFNYAVSNESDIKQLTQSDPILVLYS